MWLGETLPYKKKNVFRQFLIQLNETCVQTFDWYCRCEKNVARALYIDGTLLQNPDNNRTRK